MIVKIECSSDKLANLFMEWLLKEETQLHLEDYYQRNVDDSSGKYYGLHCAEVHPTAKTIKIDEDIRNYH